MFLAFLTFMTVNAAYLGLIGFTMYRVAKHLRGNEVAARMVLKHVVIPLFTGKPTCTVLDVETMKDGEPAVVEKEAF